VTTETGEAETASIDVRQNGPYEVRGVPLVRRRPIVSERGEPLTWQTGERIETEDTYWLCRCGESSNKPFCDGSHARVGFQGKESGPDGDYAGRATRYPAPGVVVSDDRTLCSHAGFCSNKVTNVWKLVDGTATQDPVVRAQVMSMVERCPSGALSYVVPNEGEVEPGLASEVALVPHGPLFVTGQVRTRLPDGTLLETRNRMTLCRCGESANKPFCDGTHIKVGFRAP
jgi:CDGSH-type Zn-finger protein